MNTLLLEIARHEIGVREIPGRENNPRILYYAYQAGEEWVKDDETSWCALFVAFCVSQLPGFLRPSPLQKPAKARNWLKMGVEVPLGQARPGDLVVFWRGSKSSWQGHVGFYVKPIGNDILVLGGNQNNSACEMFYSRDRLLGIRRL